MIAYPGDHTVFEAPPLVSGRRLRGYGEAEVGWAWRRRSASLPVRRWRIQLDSGAELRLRVAGIVSSLRPRRPRRLRPRGRAARRRPVRGRRRAARRPAATGANAAAVTEALGASAAAATTAIGRGVPLVDVLRSILRAVAIVDGLVCLYALIQACALTVQERRRTVAVLRACGAGGRAVRRLLAGAVLALVVPAAIVGIAARAVRARPGAVAPGRELRDAAAWGELARDRACARGPGAGRARSRSRGWRARPRGRA